VGRRRFQGGRPWACGARLLPARSPSTSRTIRPVYTGTCCCAGGVTHWGAPCGTSPAAGPVVTGIWCSASARGRPPRERALESGQPPGDDRKLVVTERLQKPADGLPARRRPLSRAPAPLRRDREQNQTAVMLIGVLADDPLRHHPGHQDRHPALGEPGQPRELADGHAGMPGYLLQQGKVRAGQREPWPVASPTCGGRRLRATARSNSTTCSCIPARPDSAPPRAAVPVIVTGTFTSEQCRRRRPGR